MRWYSIISLLSDGRVRFLLGFIIVAVIISVGLILFEIFLRKKKERRAEKSEEDIFADKMRKFLRGDKTAKEKLDFVDKTAKGYFKRVYGMPLNSGYSTLVEEFEKNNRKGEVAFCRAMFVSYYSNKELLIIMRGRWGVCFLILLIRRKDWIGLRRFLLLLRRLRDLWVGVGRLLRRRGGRGLRLGGFKKRRE